MSKYFHYSMTIAERPISEANPQTHRVRYSLPGLGFACEKLVDSEMAELLKTAIEVGKTQARQEMRHVMGIE